MKSKIVKRSKSALNVVNPKMYAPINYALTPEQIYQIDNRQLDIGVEGYMAPRSYYDYHQVMWHKKRTAILEKHKHVWPPNDWKRDKIDDRIRIKPKRLTYIDELRKWCHSFYDPKKAEALIEERNINVKEFEPVRKIDKQKRKNFLENEKKKENWRKSRPPYPEYKSDAMEEAEENKKKHEEEMKKDPILKIRRRYKDRPQTSRCDKISVLSEAIHVGEEVPFYNTYVPEGGTLNKKKLFYPSKDFVWKRYPAWKYPKPIGGNKEHQKEVEQNLKEKIEEYMNEKELKKQDLWVNVVDGYRKNTHHGEILMRIVPEFKYMDVEQYKASVENHPKVYIGPQQYWKMPKEDFRKRTIKRSMSTITDDKGNKIYYMDRKTTDKRVYTAGLRKAIY